MHHLSLRSDPAFLLRELPEGVKWNNLRFRRQLIFILDPGKDFIPMHLDRVGGFDAQADLSTLDSQDDDPDIRADSDAFTASSC